MNFDDVQKKALLETLFTDEQAHVIHQLVWGGVNPQRHNKQENGEPFGDCYKCRVIRDAVHEAILRYN